MGLIPNYTLKDDSEFFNDSKDTYIEKKYNEAILVQSIGRHEVAYEILKELAHMEYPPAQFDLGLLYYNGRGVSKSISNACKWWEKASKKGYSDAKILLNHLSNNKISRFND